MNNSQLTPYAATLLRVSLGTLALAHGLLKILVFTPAGTVGFFARRSVYRRFWLTQRSVLKSLVESH